MEPLYDRPQLETLLEGNIYDNTTGEITPAKMVEVLLGIIRSALLPLSDELTLAGYVLPDEARAIQSTDTVAMAIGLLERALTDALANIGDSSYSDANARDAAGGLLAGLVTTTLVAAYNSATDALTLNVKPNSLTLSHIAPAALSSEDFPADQMSKLQTAANWTNGVYTGTGSAALVGVTKGMFGNAGGYGFRAVADNVCICWKLTSYGS